MNGAPQEFLDERSLGRATSGPPAVRDVFVGRFRSELGYKHVHAWPIYDKKEAGGVMYHMVHATDHDEAPKLMARAYARALKRHEKPEQFKLELGLE